MITDIKENKKIVGAFIKMNIVMLPFHDCKKWIGEGYRTRDAHLAENFVNNSAVDKLLVINRPVSLAEKIVKKQNWITVPSEKIFESKNFRLGRLKNGIYCVDTYVSDFIKVAIERKNWWFTAFTYDFIKQSINKAIEILEMNDAVLLLQNPMAIGVVESVNCKKFVFDAIDNWLYHPQMSKITDIVKMNYDYVDKNADLIFTVSKALTETFPDNKNVEWISNGVDISYFASAFKEEKSEKKVIGYVGKIQDRVDFDLVEKCLNEFKDYNFVFLGPVYSQQRKIVELKNKYNNIEFMGDVHYKDLPQKMKPFDITVIPHKVDSFTNSMNPLKLYEYLAAGKQVVSTPVAGVDGISENVYISANDEEFIENIKIAIKKSETCSSKDIANTIPKEYTWEKKSNLILELISKI